MKLEFKPEWFPCNCPAMLATAGKINHHYDWCEAKEVAGIATERLAEMLNECRSVLGRLINPPDEKSFQINCVHSVIYEHSITHKARLIVEEIK